MNRILGPLEFRLIWAGVMMDVQEYRRREARWSWQKLLITEEEQGLG